MTVLLASLLCASSTFAAYRSRREKLLPTGAQSSLRAWPAVVLAPCALLLWQYHAGILRGTFICLSLWMLFALLFPVLAFLHKAVRVR